MKNKVFQGKSLKKYIAGFVLAVLVILGQWIYRELTSPPMPEFDLNGVPVYSGQPYVLINRGEPYFEESDMVTESYEMYGELDHLGRCTVTMACVGRDIMPTEERGSISSVKPTGWIQNFYDGVDGEALYNRAHLIGFQLTGENANKRNLITGTRYFNVEGMLPFENMVADYLREFPKNHVMYRVTPIFEGDELVARGVLMEAKSVEDGGVMWYDAELKDGAWIADADLRYFEEKGLYQIGVYAAGFDQPIADGVNYLPAIKKNPYEVEAHLSEDKNALTVAVKDSQKTCESVRLVIWSTSGAQPLPLSNAVRSLGSWTARA